MILAALQLELRSLLRSPLRLAIALLVLATGCFVIVQGKNDVAAWKDAIESSRQEEAETLEETRAIFASGESGPEDRPWVDLSSAHWQDWYAGTRISREPAPLAAIAFASAEAGAVTLRLNRFVNPLLAAGTEIENPALSATGGLDLITVLTLLLPLMILALGAEIGGQERASGILPLVRVQSGSDRSWITMRCVAIGLFAAVLGLGLCLGASLYAGAGALSLLPLCALVLSYVAVWTALLITIALVAQNPSQGAVALGAAWIALCVVVPAVGVERSASKAAEDFAVDLTVEARDAEDAFEDWSDEQLLTALLARFPDLKALAPETLEEDRYLAVSGLGIIDLEERAERRELQAKTQSSLVEKMSLASPAIALAHGLEQLSGRDPAAGHQYRRVVVSAVADRMERFLTETWKGTPLTAADFEDLVASSPTALESEVPSVAGKVLTLLAWALGLLALAALLSRRPRVSPRA